MSRGVSTVVRLAPLLLPLLLFLATGLRGIDFGHHWDERYQARRLEPFIDSGIPLPGKYPWPGMSYWLSLAGAVPDLAETASRGEFGPAEARQQLRKAVHDRPYRLRTRALFLVVSALAVPWIYLLVLGWRRSVLEALAAASVLASSWEFAYHARWIAPDALLPGFAALTLLGAVPGRFRGAGRGLLGLAAVAAGLGCGTKWPAGLLLVPVLLAGWQQLGARASWPARLIRGAELGLIFGVSYLVTTPGTVLEWGRFWGFVRMQGSIYASGHFGHTIGTGPEHLFAILEYLLLVFPSHLLPVAILLSVCAAVGVFALIRESRELALLVLSFPVLYVLFFSAFPVMIVRNLLVIGPFLAVLTARGVAILVRRAGPGWLGKGIAAVVTLSLLANGWWLVRAAESIRAADAASALRELAVYLEDRPEARSQLSQRVHDGLRATGTSVLPEAASDPEGADRVIFFASEAGRETWELPARRGLSMAWFGPFEVNFDYYPTWQGRDRIVVIRSSTAAGLDVSWAEPEPR